MIVKTEYLPNLGMTKDNKTGLPFKLAVLRDRDGDLTKLWYVEFYAFDEKSGQLVRKRVSISMNFATRKAGRQKETGSSQWRTTC